MQGRQLLTERRERPRQIVEVNVGRAQVQYAISALGNDLIRMLKRFGENFDGGIAGRNARRQLPRSRMHAKDESLYRLQQRVMQFAGDAFALGDALFDPAAACAAPAA